jgi:hypothetical protein
MSATDHNVWKWGMLQQRNTSLHTKTTHQLVISLMSNIHGTLTAERNSKATPVPNVCLSWNWNYPTQNGM